MDGRPLRGAGRCGRTGQATPSWPRPQASSFPVLQSVETKSCGSGRRCSGPSRSIPALPATFRFSDTDVEPQSGQRSMKAATVHKARTILEPLDWDARTFASVWMHS